MVKTWFLFKIILQSGICNGKIQFFLLIRIFTMAVQLDPSVATIFQFWGVPNGYILQEVLIQHNTWCLVTTRWDCIWSSLPVNDEIQLFTASPWWDPTVHCQSMMRSSCSLSVNDEIQLFSASPRWDLAVHFQSIMRFSCSLPVNDEIQLFTASQWWDPAVHCQSMVRSSCSLPVHDEI